MTPQEKIARFAMEFTGSLFDYACTDIDGGHLFDVALKHGIIEKLPGGFNPETHDQAEYEELEPGDPFYVMAKDVSEYLKQFDEPKS